MSLFNTPTVTLNGPDGPVTVPVHVDTPETPSKTATEERWDGVNLYMAEHFANEPGLDIPPEKVNELLGIVCRMLENLPPEKFVEIARQSAAMMQRTAEKTGTPPPPGLEDLLSLSDEEIAERHANLSQMRHLFANDAVEGADETPDGNTP